MKKKDKEDKQEEEKKSGIKTSGGEWQCLVSV